MATIKYSDLDKDLLRYALDGNEVRYAYDPLKEKLRAISSQFSEMEMIGTEIIKRLNDESSHLSNEIHTVAQELDHQNYLLKHTPEKSDDEKTTAMLRQQRAMISRNIEQCEQEIKNIEGKIAAIDAAVKECENGLSILYSGRMKFGEAENGVSYCENKLRDTCSRVMEAIRSAERAISSYLNVSISSIQNSPVAHIRRK